MATSYNTPGVYIEEISKFPPSVAQVATAVPAFIGYTQKARKDNDSLSGIPYRIRSLEEYHSLFGGAPEVNELTVQGDYVDLMFTPSKVSINITFKLYNSLELFFANGGGVCYIVSVGDYSAIPSYPALKSGLDALKKFDEPTLLAVPDAVNLAAADFGTLMADALAQASDLQDRFVIMDVFGGDETGVKESSSYETANSFRGVIGSAKLKYGAAYFPFLKAVLTMNYTHEDLSFTDSEGAVIAVLEDLMQAGAGGKTEYDTIIGNLTDAKQLRDSIMTTVGLDTFTGDYQTAMDNADPAQRLIDAATAIRDKAVGLIGILNPDAATPVAADTDLHENILEQIDADSDLKAIMEALVAYDVRFPTRLSVFTVLDPSEAPPDPPEDFSIPGTEYVWDTDLNGMGYDGAPNFELYNLGDFSTLPDIYTGATTDEDRFNQAKPYFDSLYNRMLNILNSVNEAATDVVSEQEDLLKSTAVYQKVLAKINTTPMELPPSGAVAGIYARVDDKRGVWKAPANVGVSGILGPSVKVNDEDQEDLNVDPTSGKSVNVIRAFVGKGALVWGARTLAGNDNEWRYVPVRRFFNMVEESVKKATAWAVFEPNDANLWVKLKGMIDNFLTVLWRRGALAGSTPAQAFYVSVGLNETMTAQDILEGRLIIEIGMAAVRPAEFIILKFSHKMQEA